MAEQRKFKKIMATASALAMIAAGSAAEAAQYVGTGSPVTIVDGAVTLDSTGASTPWVAGDSFASIPNGTGVGVQFGDATKIATVATYDVNSGGAVTVTANTSSVASIVNSGTGNADKATMTVQDNKTITFGGSEGVRANGASQAAGDFSALGTVTLGGGAGANMVVNGNATFTGAVESDASAASTLTVNTGSEVSFNTVGNANKLNTITINDGASATFTEGFTATNMALSGTAIIPNDKNAGGQVDGTAVDKGVLSFAGSATMSNAIGSTNRLSEVRIGSGTVTFDNAVNSKINFTADGTAIINDTKVLNGVVTTDVNGAGTVRFVANSDLGGGATSFGEQGAALKAVELQGAGTVKMNNTVASNNYANSFTFKDNAAILQFAGAANLTGNLVADTDGNGQVVFGAKGSINGLIGTDSKKFGSITSKADIVTISAGNHYTTNGMAISAKDAGFSFADGANILSGNITSSTADGLVTFAGDSNVKVEVGSSGNALASVTLSGEAGKKVTFEQNINATTTNITGGATAEFAGSTAVGGMKIGANGGGLLIRGDNDFTTGAIAIDPHTNPASIEITDNVSTAGPRTIKFGQVGNAAETTQALDLLKINANAGEDTSVLLSAGSNISSIEVHNEKAIIDFGTASAADGSYKIGGITPQTNEFGAVQITRNTVLVGAGEGAQSNIGTADAKLASIEIKDNGLISGSDHTLTLEDGVNIYAKAIINDSSDGEVIFATDAKNIFDAPNTKALRAFRLNNGSAVDLQSALIADDITLGKNAVLSVSKEVTSTNGINGANASEGTLKLVNNAELEMKTNVGTGNALAEIQFAGGDVKVATTKQLLADNYRFTSENDVNFTLSDTTAKYVGKFTNNSAEGVNHTVILNRASTEFAGDITTTGEQITVQLDDTKNATISTANVNGANFVTATDTKGELTLNKDGLTMGAIGAVSASLAKVTFAENASVTDLYATNAIVSATKTAKLAGMIDAAVDGPGAVSFVGSATVKQNMGANAALSRVDFSSNAADKVVVESTSIAATDIALNKGAVEFSKSATLAGAVAITDSNVNLFDKTVTSTGAVTINGDNTLMVDVKDTAGVLSSGRIVASNGLTVDAGATMAVTLNDQSTPRRGKNVAASAPISVIESSAAAVPGFNLANVTVTNDNIFNKWVAGTSANGGLNFTQEDNTPAAIAILSESISTTDMNNLETMCDAVAGTGASNFLNTVSEFTDGNGGFTDDAFEAIERLTPADVSEVLVDTVMAVSSGMSTRLNTLAGGHSFVAAGDDERYGAWATPFIGTATQKEDGAMVGYKADTYGASFGFDSKVNQDTVIGAAITAAHSEIDHENSKSGDESKIDLLAFSLYGKHQLNDRWSAQSVATFATNSVRTTEKRLTGVTGGVNQFDTIKSDYNAMSFSAESMMSCNHMTDAGMLTPIMGLRYSRLNTSGYQQSGSTNNGNLYVVTKPINKLDVVLGARLTGENYYLSSMMISPEIHAFVNHDVINKDGSTSLGIDGATQPLISKAGELSKTTYNVGFSLTSEYSMMEYGLGYDAHFAKKRIGHQGTIKVRVNF
ncbi:MAG: hypothetical protein DGJ47_000285 [Rickettsiaceae bacterium]